MTKSRELKPCVCGAADYDPDWPDTGAEIAVKRRCRKCAGTGWVAGPWVDDVAPQPDGFRRGRERFELLEID